MKQETNSVRFGNSTVPTTVYSDTNETDRLNVITEGRSARGGDTSEVKSATDLTKVSYRNKMQIGRIYTATKKAERLQNENNTLMFHLEGGKKVSEPRLFALETYSGEVPTMPAHEGYIVVSPTIWEMLWVKSPELCGVMRVCDYTAQTSEGKDYRTSLVVCLYKGAALPDYITADILKDDCFDMPAWCK